MSRREEARRALRNKFLAVASDRIAALHDAVLALEDNPDDEATRAQVMREIHTLKGEARLVGFPDINTASHKTEELLLNARDLDASQRGALNSVIVAGLDLLQDMVDKESGTGEVEPDLPGFEERADAALESAKNADDKKKKSMRPQAAASDAALRQMMRLRGERSIRVELVKLHELTTVAGDLQLGHDRTRDAVEEMEHLLEAFGAALIAMETEIAQLRSGPSRSASDWKSMVDALARRTTGWPDIRAAARQSMSLGRDCLFDGRLGLENLDNHIRELRLQPLATVLRKYPRAVRELAVEKGKTVQLDIQGADVEVDKEVLEKLGEPLLHLIRNAVDHGIERPEERRQAGKEESGTLTISARQLGSTVRIEVRDDGKGMDAARVGKAAVRKGVLSPDHLARRSDEEILQLVFEPGFSTMEKVTDLSGRGVGLDVVKENLESLGGSVKLETEFGKGTAFILTAPIAMVFTRALIFRCGESLFAIPSDAVDQVVEVDPGEMESVGSGTVVRVAERRVPIIDLRSVLGQKSGASPAETAERVRVVVVRHGSELIALTVDLLIGEQQIVQRSFDPFLSEGRLLAGSAVLQSGVIAILLDVNDLMHLSSTGTSGRIRTGGDESEEQVSGHRVLVVDDSEITRDLIVTILRNRSYIVSEAVNGKDALEKLEGDLPDLVVTDLEMPLLDGFGLVREMRANAATKDIPIIVFSTRGSEGDRRKASEFGADAYMVKGSFREEDLLQLMSRFLGSKR